MGVEGSPIVVGFERRIDAAADAVLFHVQVNLHSCHTLDIFLVYVTRRPSVVHTKRPFMVLLIRLEKKMARISTAFPFSARVTLETHNIQL